MIGLQMMTGGLRVARAHGVEDDGRAAACIVMSAIRGVTR